MSGCLFHKVYFSCLHFSKIMRYYYNEHYHIIYVLLTVMPNYTTILESLNLSFFKINLICEKFLLSFFSALLRQSKGNYQKIFLKPYLESEMDYKFYTSSSNSVMKLHDNCNLEEN